MKILEPKPGTHQLDNPKEPNLFRDQFPYTEVPKTVFDGLLEVPEPPEEIWITDTTFRDGQQARLPFTVEQILTLYEMLHRLSGPKGIIRQSEFFLYSEKDREAVEKCLEKGFEYPQVTGWIRATKSDFKLVKEMNLKSTGILTSASDYHIFLKLKRNRQEAMEGYLDIVKDALDNGLSIRCHFEDITRADIYGFCVPFAQELMKLQEESGLEIKVRLCDTMGYGLPYLGVALPRSVPKLVRAMIKDAGVPSKCLEWHGHNDFHKVHVNSIAAWLHGCSGVNAALAGLGERTGNSPLEALVIEYMSLTGSANGMDTTVITEIGDYLRSFECEIPDNYPFIGRFFNTTRAGIHADGVLKNEEIYNIFDTEEILNRRLGVVVTDKSGVAGIAHWINDNLLNKGQKIDKRHPGIASMYEWVQEEYNSGRTTGISQEEMMSLCKKHIPELFEQS